MKLSAIALIVLAGSAYGQVSSNQKEPWSTADRGGPALYDPAKGPLTPTQRFVLTREGIEEQRYNAMNPAPAMVIAQAPAPVAAPVIRSYALPTRPERVVGTAPEWFLRMPADTVDMLFAAAVGSSSDEQMAYDKARLQAERKLVEMMSSRVRSNTKSYRSDRGDTLIENTEITIQKSADGELIGAQRVDSQAVFDGRQYKVYVLLRLPLAENNTLRRERESQQTRREADLRAARAQQELARETEKNRQAEAEATQQLKKEIGPLPESSSKVTSVIVPEQPRVAETNQGSVQLLDVDNVEYRKRRDDALAKPGAVLGQITVR